MKRLTLILLTAILSVHLPAQNLTDKFGKVSEWEAAMTSYDKDPEAEALYIYDKRDLAFMNDFRYDLTLAMIHPTCLHLCTKLLSKARKGDAIHPEKSALFTIY